MKRILLAAVLAIPLWQAPAPASAAAATHVAMSRFAFGPASVTITVGDTVTWANHDEAPHDAVTTDAPAQFRSPLLERGHTWSFTFSVPGTYRYYCSVHPAMRATIIVRPKQQPQPSPAQSSARPAPIVTSSQASAPPPPLASSPTPSPPAPDRRPLVVTVGVTLLASLFSLFLLSGTR